jgi:hypothetical protein
MRSVTFVLLLLLCCPAPAAAWGYDAHKFITEQMITLLPAELRPLFERRKAHLLERCIDPDLWRIVGWEEEDPHHFVDLDFFGTDPFTELPREYDRAVQKFGRDVIHEQGLLPWRTAEFYGRLQRTFESLKRDSPPSFASDNIVLFSAILAHYVQDGHVPLHAVVNYDGARTNQLGIHSRWESELFERTRSRVVVKPAPVQPIGDPRDYMFDVLLASYRLSDGVLAADRKAAAGREFYDDGYFEVLAAEQFGVMQRRLNDAITAVASMIVGAWDQAGRPALPAEAPRKPRPIPRPKG